MVWVACLAASVAMVLRDRYHRYLTLDKVGCQSRQFIVLPFGEAKFDV